ncbi:KDP operon transcriptional regulatory protein KdpE [Roseovarius litorisediminis]|uniref:KDP operon transcriptional regulatory protein KdpE n=1 Tax=Roseovarius litorisediminis TaxID=1312363 RepID=A0A1Y5T0L3_9RHOB|nr:response regulator [Roseovarius litorisediminis]SLN50993.1 KDP operon transcriptional regulatory protein KdpE [Roseovarius litorisediminis]
MDEFEGLSPLRMPTRNRPLLGLTVLAVEDSRFSCEALRLMCLRSGARIRRADCLRAARRHLQVYRPSVAIVDLGLPDGPGVELIKELDHATPRVEVILGVSGDDDSEARAMAAGADDFLPKPLTNLAAFQHKILSLLPVERQPIGPRIVSHESIDPDPIAYLDDMAHVANLLDGQNDGAILDYASQFLSGVARSAKDAPLADAASELARCRKGNGAVKAHLTVVTNLIHQRLSKRLAI